MLRHPTSTRLFPYTTLFRSRADALVGEVHLLEDLVQRLQSRLDEHAQDEPLTLTASVPGLARTQPPAHARPGDRKSTRLNSSHTVISYAVFCLKKKRLRWCC